MKNFTFIDKETGSEIDQMTISVIIKNETYRRDFAIITGTAVEHDCEYFSGTIDSIIYDIQYDPKCRIERVERILNYKTIMEIPLFIRELMRHNNRFDITQDMIENSKLIGPILIIGKSRVVEL